MTLSQIVAVVGTLELASLVFALVAMTVRRNRPSALNVQRRMTPARIQSSGRARESARSPRGIAVSSRA